MKFLAAPARFLLESLPGLARGLFWIVFIAWAVATATFVLMKAIPGGPLSNERKVPESVQKAIEERYHLNDPTLVQYKNYILDAARLDFGLSFIDPGWTVGEIIRQRFPRSALLGAVALLFSIGMAFPLGMGAHGLWWGMAVGLTVTGSLLAVRFVVLTARMAENDKSLAT